MALDGLLKLELIQLQADIPNLFFDRPARTFQPRFSSPAVADAAALLLIGMDLTFDQTRQLISQPAQR